MQTSLNSFERIIAIFTRVRPGEGPAVAVFSCYACLIIASYYIFKTLREPLIIGSAVDADAKAYATAYAALVLLIFMPIYSKMFRSCSRERLVMGMALMFAGMGFMFAMMNRWDINIGYTYYIWVSIYGVVMVSQFWVFATGSFNIKSGKRLFPVILIGASAGGLLGAQISGLVIRHGGITSGILLASTIIAITAVFPSLARTSVPEASQCVDCHRFKSDNTSLLGGLAVVLRSRLMILIAIYALLLNIINTSGEYLFAETLLRHIEGLGITDLDERQRYIGETYAQFAFWVTAIALFLQMFVVSRIFIFFGMSTAAMLMPILITIGYFMGGFFPFFTFIHALKIVDNSLDYSLTNNVRQTLFLPVSHAEKFEAKTAIDTVLWRAGDLVQAGIIFVSIHWLGWGVKEISILCGVLGVFWIYTARHMVVEYHRRVKEHPSGQAPRLNRPIDYINIMPGARLNYLIPEDTFVADDPSDSFTLSATLKTGEKLPSWLQFSTKENAFTGFVPHDVEQTPVTIIASDKDGLSAKNDLVLNPLRNN